MRVYLAVTAVAVGLLAVWAARGDVGLAGMEQWIRCAPQLADECSESTCLDPPELPRPVPHTPCPPDRRDDRGLIAAAAHPQQPPSDRLDAARPELHPRGRAREAPAPAGSAGDHHPRLGKARLTSAGAARPPV